MRKKSIEANPFLGRWRIVSMAAWVDEFLDEEVEAYIEFNDRGWGEFHFGNVQGQMDCRLTMAVEPVIEWSWDGNAEMDAAQGRGWATASGDELHGMIFIHGSDDSVFVAKRLPETKRTKGR
jgi:hypothetical protein